MKEIRKLVSELNVGDDVKGYGVLTMCHDAGLMGWVVEAKGETHRSGLTDNWPADAEVTVLLPEPKYRVLRQFETGYGHRITVEEVES